MVWTREGTSGTFIGRKTTEETDIAAYKQPEETDQTVAAAATRTEPEGFVIENPITGQAEIVIDQMPEPAEGNQHKIIWCDASGASGTIPVNILASLGNNASFSGSQGAYHSNNMGGASQNQSASVTPLSAAGMLLFTLPNVGGLTSFQLVETPIIPDGSPARVIVEGGH
jgi:hypothetical protein